MHTLEKIKKPEHVKEDIWRQRLDWLDVMGKKADENFAQHVIEVKKNGGRVK